MCVAACALFLCSASKTIQASCTSNSSIPPGPSPRTHTARMRWQAIPLAERVRWDQSSDAIMLWFTLPEGIKGSLSLYLLSQKANFNGRNHHSCHCMTLVVWELKSCTKGAALDGRQPACLHIKPCTCVAALQLHFQEINPKTACTPPRGYAA